MTLYLHEVLNKAFSLPVADIDDETLWRIFRHLEKPRKFPYSDNATQSSFDQYLVRAAEIKEETYRRRNGIYNIGNYILRIAIPFKPDNVRIIDSSTWNENVGLELASTCLGDIKVHTCYSEYYGRLVRLNEYETSRGEIKSLNSTGFRYQTSMKWKEDEMTALLRFLYNLQD